MQTEDIRISEYVSNRRRRKVWQEIVKLMACVVVFCTVYALILPAITQERETYCGQEVHTHSDQCYTQTEADQTSMLVCTYGYLGIHTHSEACTDAAGNLICGLADYVLHTHDGSCMDADGNLVCTLPEISAHVHGEDCYQTVQAGHTHTEACYTLERGDLTCSLAEDESHTHTDECYAWNNVLACTAEECDPVVTLVCAVPEEQTHVHTESCFQLIAEQTLTCGLEAHTHSLMCYSDPTADVEDAAAWEKTFASAALTGVWKDDVLTIAKTQLGYQESTRNYIVLEDGQTTKGYTRYGAWYGDPYGDWCAMFISFCLEYAGVDEMPSDSNCNSYIAQLTEAKLYRAQGSYVPESSDLVFFDWDADGDSDHVGIVTAVTTDEETGVIQIATIEGNSANQVQAKVYSMDDGTILGYGLLPDQTAAQEAAQIERVIAMIDAIPTADEIDAKLAEYEEAGDYEGMEAWYTEVCQQVAEAYYYYNVLSDQQKALVTNADKLLELEYIWSVTTYNSVITSTAPSEADWTSTKDFIELNLYDYNFNINRWWNSDNKYPGFQWNGGAYSKTSYRYYVSSADSGVPNYTTDRNRIDSIDFGNSMITNFSYGNTSNYAKSVNATTVVSQGGLINTIDITSYGVTNRPTGFSVGTEVLSRTLINGYPALIDKTSLSYLFGDEAADTYDAVTKLNTEAIDGLFLQDSETGEYSYNSRENHAQFSASDNRFVRYNQIITPNFITYPFGNFLPLNSITNLNDATQVGAFNYAGGMKKYVDAIKADLTAANTAAGTSDWKYTTRKQLITMLDEYAENWAYYDGNWSALSPANAIKDYFQMDGDNPSEDVSFVTQTHLNNLYNIDWDVDTNFFFGMEMKMTFMQPKGGMTGNDNDGDGESDYPMVFYFTGDDDVWVYIDGVLFLDLSGIHRHVGGEIDFVNGVVKYYALDTATGDVSTTAYVTYTFKELLEAAGASTSGLNSSGTFTDYTTHNFKFYYMERGSGSSVCRLNFNFPLLKRNSITVTKENITVDSDGNEVDAEVLGNPDYYFNIVNSSNELFVGPDSVTGVYQYTVMESNGETIKNADGTDKIFETDQYGIFTLKAGQTAVFNGIKENSGKYYVQELIKAADNAQYPIVYINSTQTRYNALVDWQYRTYFSGLTTFDSKNPIYTGPYGYEWYGRSGYDTDSSTNAAFHFEQQNRVDVSKLGSLSITKKVESYVMALANTYFKIYVELDGEPLPVGTSYTVGGKLRKVTEAGYMEIAAGETATLANIISGTQFYIQEESGSAEGYTVTYGQTNADEATSNGTSISGVVRVNTNVAVVVTNSEVGTTVTIPGTKSLVNPDGAEHSYTFSLTEVTDSTGATVKDGGLSGYQATATTTDGTDDFSFTINYIQVDIGTLPAKFYYRITENGAADSLVNTTVYVAEVTITETADGIAAAVTGMWKDGAKVDTLSADFVNTLSSSLTLEKTVDGGTDAQNQGFTFTIKLEGENLPTSYPAVFYQQDGTAVEQTVYPNSDGCIVLKAFKHGEKAVISGIPYGTKWTVSESGNDGYTVTTQVTTGETVTDSTGSVTAGEITMDGITVAYTNAAGYELPETGGAGTKSYTMAGLVIILGAVCLMYIRSKRRKGGNCS